MAVLTKKPTRRTRNAPRAKSKIVSKNGHGTTKAVRQNGVYMLRPRRLSPSDARRAKRLAALVRKEMAAHETGTLDEAMRSLRGRSWE